MKKVVIVSILMFIAITIDSKAVRKEINWCVGAVQGDCVGGNVSIGAAKDKLSVDDSTIFVQNLGTIKQTTERTEIALPFSGQKIIAFTPTQKKYANRQIKLLFYAFALDTMPKGLSNSKIYQEAIDAKTNNQNAKTMLKVYYKLPMQDQWTEFLTSVNEKPFTAIKPSITVDNGARLSYYPQKYEDDNGNTLSPQPIIFDLNSM